MYRSSIVMAKRQLSSLSHSLSQQIKRSGITIMVKTGKTELNHIIIVITVLDTFLLHNSSQSFLLYIIARSDFDCSPLQIYKTTPFLICFAHCSFLLVIKNTKSHKL